MTRSGRLAVVAIIEGSFVRNVTELIMFNDRCAPERASRPA
jgi:hypothetical protein